MAKQKTGIWIIGGFGGVAATSAVGLANLQAGRLSSTGLVSCLPQFSDLPFVNWEDFIVGGHEIRKSSLMEAAQQLVSESRAFDASLMSGVETTLAKWGANFRPGIVRGAGKTIELLADREFCNVAKTVSDAIQSVKVDLAEFRDQNELEQVIVVNLASTEPPSDFTEIADDWSSLEKQLANAESQLPPSSVYAIAAIESEMPFVNFTPSVGSNLNAIRQLAEQKRVCHVGRDGKTGETFLKSVLAPAFGARNLEVMSWVGHNIFGNRDGIVLNDPQNKATKVKSKDSLLGQVLGYQPQTHTSIEYIQSLGDWKTACDHIHFRGFMGTPMVLQLTWQGCDSILAAPLVLDLVRFTELAQRNGEFGELGFLSSFFKSPQGTAEQSFANQFEMLVDWTSKQRSISNS
ncbi:MAG: inositol-3-phosphate synthase [Pirellulaceae bacterium]